jgi:hypothetical protein
MDRKEDIWEFEKLEQQLHSFLSEISELSKKKPSDALNKFKLKFINVTVAKLNGLLADYKPFEDFDQFEADLLPNNSDVVVILSQYAAASHRFRIDNSDTDDAGDWCWVVRGKVTDIPAGDPEEFKYDPK